MAGELLYRADVHTCVQKVANHRAAAVMGTERTDPGLGRATPHERVNRVKSHGQAIHNKRVADLWQRFRVYLEDSGFPKGTVKLHRMRNTWVSDQLRRKTPETMIALSGGWEHTDMIRHYAKHLPMDVLREYLSNGTLYKV